MKSTSIIFFVTGLGVEDAVVFVILAYFFLKVRRIIFHAPPFQQAFYIGLFALLGVFLQGMVLHLFGYAFYVEFNVLSVVTTMIIWPAVCYFLMYFLNERVGNY